MFSIRQITPAIRLALMNLKTLSEQNQELKQRELETSGTRILLNALFHEPQAELKYDSNRKPYLSNYPGHISISHSHDRLAIIHHLYSKTGIDIELIRDKVKGIQHKFLNEAELLQANNDTETLVEFWAVKETLYKINGTKGIDFKKNLFIEQVDAQRVLGRIDVNGKISRYALIKEKTDNYILVYAEKEV